MADAPVAVRVRVRTAESATAAPVADVSVPAGRGDGPAAVAAAAVRAAGGEAAALAAAPGSRVAAFHRPGAAFPWLPAAGGGAAPVGRGTDAGPSLVVCVTAADVAAAGGGVASTATTEPERPQEFRPGPRMKISRHDDGTYRLFATEVVDGTETFVDRGQVLQVRMPCEGAEGFGEYFRVIYRPSPIGWPVAWQYCEPARVFCAAAGIPVTTRAAPRR